MDKDKLFKEVAEYLEGSCKFVQEAFSDVCQYSNPPIEMVEQDVLDEFEDYLEKNDLYCCSECGWWGFQGGDACCECDSECPQCYQRIVDCVCGEEDEA